MKKKIIICTTTIITLIAIVTVGTHISAMNLNKNSIQMKKSILFLSDNIDLSYDQTIDTNGIDDYIYLDENSNQYIYQNDKLVGYIKKNSTPSSDKNTDFSSINKNEKIENNKKIADNILRSIIDNEKGSISDYILTTSSFVNSYDETVYVYTKYISDYKTNDSIMISLDLNGELSSFNANRQGKFNNYENIVIDKTKVEKYVSEQITNSFSNLNYEIVDQLIDIVNNKVVLSNYIKLVDSNGIMDSTVVYYEL